uniref:NudC domain-containing protein 1 n=1 Tax=Strongyloides stercoralis TaxID=6248 RepID=A0AAF5D591_STRER
MTNNSHIVEIDTSTEKPKEKPKETPTTRRVGLWIGIDTSISTKSQDTTSDVISSNIKVEDLNSFKKKSDPKKETKNKELLEKKDANKEVSSTKSTTSNPSKQTYQFREKKSSNSKINENIDTIAVMKSQLENIKKVTTNRKSGKKSKESSSSTTQSDNKDKDNIKKTNKVSNEEDNKKKKKRNKKSKCSKNSKSKSQSDENSKEIFYSCSSDAIEKSTSSSNFRPSLALSDNEIEKLNRIHKSTNSFSFKKSDNNMKAKKIDNSNSTTSCINNMKNIEKDTVKRDNNKHKSSKINENTYKKNNKNGQEVNKSKNIEETTYTVTEPEDIIEYNVSKNAQCKDENIQNINLINNGTYLNQSFINLPSDFTHSLIQKSKSTRKGSVPLIKSYIPKTPDDYSQFNEIQSFVRNGQYSQWVKKRVTPSVFDYEIEKSTIKKPKERFEIVDETSKTEDNSIEYDIVSG